MVAVEDLLQHSLVGQVAQALVQDVAGDAQVLLELGEAGDPPRRRRAGDPRARASPSCSRLRKVQTRCGYRAASFRGRVELYGVTRHGTGTARSHGEDGQGLTSEHRRQG
jgi:hypothetical protein